MSGGHFRALSDFCLQCKAAPLRNTEPQPQQRRVRVSTGEGQPQMGQDRCGWSQRR